MCKLIILSSEINESQVRWIIEVHVNNRNDYEDHQTSEIQQK